MDPVTSLTEITPGEAVQALLAGEVIEIFPDGSASYKLKEGEIFVSLDEEKWQRSSITFLDFKRYRWGQRLYSRLPILKLPHDAQKALDQISAMQSSSKTLVRYFED